MVPLRVVHQPEAFTANIVNPLTGPSLTTPWSCIHTSLAKTLGCLTLLPAEPISHFLVDS